MASKRKARMKPIKPPPVVAQASPPRPPVVLPPIRGSNFPESYVDRRIARILGYSQRSEAALSADRAKVPGLIVVSTSRRGVHYRDESTGFELTVPWGPDVRGSYGDDKRIAAINRMATTLGAPALSAPGPDTDRTIEMKQADVLAAIEAADVPVLVSVDVPPAVALFPGALPASQDDAWSDFAPAPDSSTVFFRLPPGMTLEQAASLPELAPDALAELPTIDFDAGARAA